MRPLQKEIIKCKELISEIYIKKYDQEEYAQIVYTIFSEIFTDYFNKDCPDKLEPKIDRLSKESLEKIRRSQGLK